MLLITTLFALLSFGGPQTAAPAEYVVGPQDVLSIVVFGEEDLKKTVALDADGTFDFPYVGRIKAGGLTARAIGEDIAGKLKKFYVNPQVSVEVVKFRSQNIFVFGQVHAPGQYPLSGNMSVLQALAMAGGATEKGAPNRVRIFRTVDGKQQEVKGVKLADLVRAGDTIDV